VKDVESLNSRGIFMQTIPLYNKFVHVQRICGKKNPIDVAGYVEDFENYQNLRISIQGSKRGIFIQKLPRQ
jgi:hypothetical protein